MVKPAPLGYPRAIGEEPVFHTTDFMVLEANMGGMSRFYDGVNCVVAGSVPERCSDST